ncbi:unnamed protein product [Linum trigynum]|uniref:Uncharacterized protein n=1 Tax=Linum trigynum TaxID=586398 RepID=A0AAV2GQX5_9ROSI
MGETRRRFPTLANLVNAGLERHRSVLGLSLVASVLVRVTLLVVELSRFASASAPYSHVVGTVALRRC